MRASPTRPVAGRGRARWWLGSKVKDIDSAQKIIRVEQSKGRKDRNVMLSPETLDLLRLFPGTKRGKFG
jgi:integrase